MISTNYVFPRIIKVSEEKTLIWDQTYWELFSLYLAYFTDLNAMVCGILRPVQMERQM